MDDYPAADPIPNPSMVDSQHAELIDFLTTSREMRQTAKSAVKQSLYAAGGALTGGFLLGPIGGLVGGIAGSIVGFVQSDNYDGALLAISKLEDSRKKVLMQSVTKVLMAAGATAQSFESSSAFRDALVEFVSTQPRVREELWNTCRVAVQETLTA